MCVCVCILNTDLEQTGLGDMKNTSAPLPQSCVLMVSLGLARLSSPLIG